MRKPPALIPATLTLLLAVCVATSFAQQSGYYVLDGFGGVHAGGGAPAVSPQTPYFGFDAAEDIVYVPPGSQGLEGVLVLDAFGGVYAGGAIAGGSLAPPTPYFGFDIARGLALRSRGGSGWERRGGSCTSVPAGGAAGGSVTCGSKKVTGGGVVYFTDSSCSTPITSIATTTRVVTHSGPTADNVWAAGVSNGSASVFYLKFYAICMNTD